MLAAKSKKKFRKKVMQRRDGKVEIMCSLFAAMITTTGFLLALLFAVLNLIELFLERFELS